MYESGWKSNPTYKTFAKQNDYNLMIALKAEPKGTRTYEIIMAVLWDRYLPQIHKNWWELQRQMNNLTAVNLMKDDYYSEAAEAFTVAIDKIDLSRVENDKFKCVGMLNWYLTNVRTKIITKIKRAPQTKPIDLMSRIGDEDSMIADRDVEDAYWESEGYKLEPDFCCEKNDIALEVQAILRECKAKWSWEETQVFERMFNGEKRMDIANDLSIKPDKVSSIMVKLKKELKVKLAETYQRSIS